MWLVGKDTTGKTGRVAISDELKAALVRWYTGRGSEADHRASVSLVSTARENHKWIACDCLGAERPPPLMSAAYLSFQETYYLRRLTSRPGHEPGCPFHLPQAPQRIRETMKDSLYAIGLPKGLFSAHQKAPEKLAQRPDDIEPDDRSRGVAIPRLGKLLWLLLERAGSNILRELPPSGRRAGSISEEMRHLKHAAQSLEIAPGSLRAFSHRYAQLTLVFVVLALAVKALVPAGYMISSANERFLTVTICADASGTPKQMRIAIPDKDETGSDHSDTADKSQPCAFAGLGHAALGGADPILLAAALTFILLVGFAPLRAPPARDIPFLRPPLRGPPPLSV